MPLAHARAFFLACLDSVLEYGDQRGHPLPLHVEPADHVARALGRDHDDVDVLVRLDEPEMDRQPVAEQEGLALREVRQDVLLVDARPASCRAGRP